MAHGCRSPHHDCGLLVANMLGPVVGSSGGTASQDMAPCPFNLSLDRRQQGGGVLGRLVGRPLSAWSYGHHTPSQAEKYHGPLQALRSAEVRIFLLASFFRWLFCFYAVYLLQMPTLSKSELMLQLPTIDHFTTLLQLSFDTNQTPSISSLGRKSSSTIHLLIHLTSSSSATLVILQPASMTR